MPLKFGLTGMDPATEADLKTAFAEANAATGGHWQLAPEGDADFVVVDMDSMYGPMSWLKLHASGKTVIGLTSSQRTQTDFLLQRPFTTESLSKVLDAISAKAADPVAASARAEPLDEAVSIPAAPPAPDIPAAATPSGLTPAPQATDQLPEEQPMEAHPEPVPAPAPPAPARDPVFSDWLAPHMLSGKLRYQREGGPVLLIDADARQYHGPAVLKPLADYYKGNVDAGDFTPADPATWAAEAGKLGAAQPLARLAWYGGLQAGGGSLLPGYDPQGKFHLTKWPQTEREFPKHFRIATAMMKGPATLQEIAEASGVPVADVTDFVNANLATGFAEQWEEPAPEPTDAQKPGLFGRLRGR
ncbi:MAG TPA: hypothetical protein VFM73_05745 [Xanthomonadaceae bacterium]|nr:hypothetical protein [Xanthomonadaceae bacterium]